MASSKRRRVLTGMVLGTLAFLPAAQSHGQGRPPPETWWVSKTKGGIYKEPNRPIWRQADLLKAHAGQSNWSEQIVRDPEAGRHL